MASIRAKIIILIILLACLAVPALAGTKYLDGSPNLTAYIAGTNQYTAGSDIQIPVVIKNIGISTNFEVASNIVDRADVPTTAKYVTVGMGAGEAPVVIKSDPQMIGDIASQAQQTVTFSAKVNADAAGGTYYIPLTISYTQFSNVDQYGLDTLQYYYVPGNVTITVPLVIKPGVIPDVVSATSGQLVAGANGYVNLTIKNIGSLDGSKATIQILQDDDSPVSPVDSSVYIGAFPAGSTVSCQYKVSVAKDAENKTYPVDVIVVYQDNEGDFVPSQTQVVGVDVGNKVSFAIQSPPVEMSPGSKRTIQVEYQNSVASDATIKEYGLDSEIRYNDALDDTYVSDPMKISIDVKNLAGIQGVVSNPVYISLIVAVIIGVIYAVMHAKRKR